MLILGLMLVKRLVRRRVDGADHPAEACGASLDRGAVESTGSRAAGTRIPYPNTTQAAHAVPTP